VCHVLGTGSTAVGVRPLTGGNTSAIHAVTVEDGDGGTHTAVLRRWVQPGWEESNPDFTVASEALALESVAGISVATPRVLATDESGRHAGAPALLMELLPGTAPDPAPEELPSFLRQLARAAAEIHTLETGEGLPAYRPYNDLTDPRVPSTCKRPDLWLRAFEIVGGPPPAARTRLIHRDYHYGNTLWSGGALTGIVDWGYASRGPASIDLAHMRWNLVVGYGPAAADRFLAAYLDHIGGGFAHHPYWDLRTVVDLTPEPVESGFSTTDIDRLEAYVESLLRAF
jgi:aminoglycoside phosphotransferase (APT) family kinase protein